MVVQPFEKIEGLSTMKYNAIFVSDSIKKPVEDRERYHVFVELDPWDKVVSCNCECKGFKFGKGNWCKHISSEKTTELGILQLLLHWGEIQSIPKNEQETKTD